MDAALEIIAEVGVSRLSMRELARRTGVSSGAPYRHFADLTDLLSALADEATTYLDRAHFEAGGRDSPLDRFRSMGVEFAVFAAEFPLHFRLMCDPGLASNQRFMAIQDHADARLEKAIAEALEAGQIDGDATAIALTARAAIYGLAHMIVDGHLGEVSPARAAELALAVTSVLGSGFVNPGRSDDR